MSLPKKRSGFYQQEISSLILKTKEEFIAEYRGYDEVKSKTLYFQVLLGVKEVISDNKRGTIADIGYLEGLSKLIDYINSAENWITLVSNFNDIENPLRGTNLVILACKFENVAVLDYLFGDGNRILNGLSVDIKNISILPSDEDEEQHNAFYYAIRSNNVCLLDILICKWPCNYLKNHSLGGELDELLSKNYEELKLKNVPVSDQMKIYVESKLIHLRFFTCDFEEIVKVKPSQKTRTKGKRAEILEVDQHFNIKQRIKLICDNVNTLRVIYSNEGKKIDGKFMFLVKFIAQNIHILKHKLKSTYDKLPWEEIEFCIVCFVSALMKQQQEMNFFYRSVLGPERILNHLHNFVKTLQDQVPNILKIDINKLKKIPKLQRAKVIADIIGNCSHFVDLYIDYERVRDVYSLEIMSKYIDLALITDSNDAEKCLIITRALQVIGEHLKSTLESPKLSSATSKFLLLLTPQNTREIITELRDSVSHCESLSKRMQIEENITNDILTNIQNDIKKIGMAINGILYENKIKTMRTLLKKMVDSKSWDEMKEIGDIMNYVELEKILSFPKMKEQVKIEQLIEELSSKISKKTKFEEEMFQKIIDTVNKEKMQFENFSRDYIVGFGALRGLANHINLEKKENRNTIKRLKSRAYRILDSMTSKLEPQTIRNISVLLMKILDSVEKRMAPHNDLNDFYRIAYKIFHLATFETRNIKWIDELGERLKNNMCHKNSSILPHNKKKVESMQDELSSNILGEKLSSLEGILSSHGLKRQSIDIYPLYKHNKKLQLALEMLVLDVMSILGSSRNNNKLTHNILFLDDNSPLVNGKCLRNHLAHGNVLMDLLSFDPSLAVFYSAKNLIEEKVYENNKKIGKLVKEDSSKFIERATWSVSIIANQEKMFSAMVDGNLNNLRRCITKGADIYSRSLDLWTSLHFSAKGPSLEVLKYVLEHDFSVDTKDINGQCPLHIAVNYERKVIAEFLLENRGIFVDTPDNSGRTSLHIAAQNGSMDLVKILLKNNASSVIKDKFGFSPLHYAVSNNHIEVVDILLGKEENVDSNEAMDGLTPLHISAAYGCLELVYIFLKKNANVNAKNDKGCMPLHAATLNGHTEIVKALILNGTEINTEVIDGSTPLHYAVKNGYDEIVEILLQHGAIVNAANNVLHNIPLHYAAKEGHTEVAKLLLNHSSEVNAVNVGGMTPLAIAAENNHLDLVSTLMQYRALTNVADIHGLTALHRSVLKSNRDVVRFLIEKGCNINSKDKNNRTALHLAAFNGNKEIIELLTKEDVDINAADIEGSTPLHISTGKDDFDILQILLDNGAVINAKDNDSRTPLHIVAYSSVCNKQKIALFLLRNGADVNSKDSNGLTPIHLAASVGNEDIIDVLLEGGADYNIESEHKFTPLHVAVEGNHRHIVDKLLDKNININSVDINGFTPLCYAVGYSYRGLIKLLISKGCDVNAGNGPIRPLPLAVSTGIRDVVITLLKVENIEVNDGFYCSDKATSLHVSAKQGQTKIMEDLLANGADIDAVTATNETSLYFAAQEGHVKVVKILLEKGANVNIVSKDGTSPLHVSAALGHNHIACMLLNNGAKACEVDNENRTPLELAVLNCKLEVIEILLKQKEVCVHSRGYQGRSLLHLAAQNNNVIIVKSLIDNGAELTALNDFGSKPAHISAREGCKDVLEYFLQNGFNINDRGQHGFTLLHYAAFQGHSFIAEYLLEQKISINAVGEDGSMALHIAANFGHKNMIEVLLDNGAIYNAKDKLNRKPVDVASCKDVIHVLKLIKKLFSAVKRNHLSEVEECIIEGAFINAKNKCNITPLHLATWKGYVDVVEILLKNKANPNTVGNGGFTPLHYSCKISQLNICKMLLSKGAIYNVMAHNLKIPLDYTDNKDIINLLKLIGDSFNDVHRGNCNFINVLNEIEDLSTIRSVMNACNEQCRTLVVVAMRTNFPKAELLKQLHQDDVVNQIEMANKLIEREKFDESLSMYEKILKKRINILGPDNPGTLDIWRVIGKVMYKQKKYESSLRVLENVHLKQKELFGYNHRETLNTCSFLALVLLRQGKYDESLRIYQEVCEMQTDILGSKHSDTLDSQLRMAQVLNMQGKLEESLHLNQKLYETSKELFDESHLFILNVQANIAMVLSDQGKHAEALRMYEGIYETQMKVLGMHHSDTLNTLSNIARELFCSGYHNRALIMYQTVLALQKEILGPHHLDSLNTQYNIGKLLFCQKKVISAFRAFKESFEHRKMILGPKHPEILDTLQKLKMIKFMLGIVGYESLEYI